MSLDNALLFALEPAANPVPDAAIESAVIEASVVGVLSRREMEVLRLLAEGRSNQEIALALSISPHTVANHVAGIMSKLGLESRTAVATYAVRNRMV